MKEQLSKYSSSPQEEAYSKDKSVLVLLEHGADVTARDNTHSTPLHRALSLGSPDIVRLLIEHGADVNAPNRDHKMPLHLASVVSVKTA